MPVLLGCLSSLLAQEDQRIDILVEAEDVSERVSKAKDFAIPTLDYAASGGRVLVRLFGKGHLVYGFGLPAAGKYSVWVRYAGRRDVRSGYALDPEGEVVFKRKTLPATGALTGTKAYRFALLLRQKLARGERRLLLAKPVVPVRPGYLEGVRGYQLPT